MQTLNKLCSLNGSMCQQFATLGRKRRVVEVSVLEEVTKSHASPRSLHVGLRLRVTVSCGLI